MDSNFSHNETHFGSRNVTSSLIFTVFFVSFGSIVIVATILGNILVIVAICTERRIRKVGNSFIVSLACSDLLVGVMVTPVALAYEVQGHWPFGAFACDLWVSIDVICCTASIVNLCVISFDRYNAIRHPLKYALKRTPRRAGILISLVWSYSLVIALPPLFGWREPRPSTLHCAVSQDKAYTIYSTCGAFYLPLCVMVVMYAMVFRATQQRKKTWVTAAGGSQLGGTSEVSVLISATDSIRRYQAQQRQQQSSAPDSRASPDTRTSTDSLEGIELRRIVDRHNATQASPHTTHRSCFAAGRRRHPQPAPPDVILTQESQSCDLPSSQATGHLRGKSLTVTNGNSSSCNSSPCDIAHRHHRQRKHNSDPEITSLRLSPRPSFNHARASLVQALTSFKRKRRSRRSNISLNQEHRAAKTLGIIVGCFLISWLPFFLLALILPFCYHCKVPEALMVVITWMGYLNSALNPVIYTCFNHDFRIAFKRIFYCKLRERTNRPITV